MPGHDLPPTPALGLIALLGRPWAATYSSNQKVRDSPGSPQFIVALAMPTEGRPISKLGA